MFVINTKFLYGTLSMRSTCGGYSFFYNGDRSTGVDGCMHWAHTHEADC